MGPYKGDFTTSDTVYVMFDSFSSDDPSASITLTGLAVTDIEIYKNGGTTQRASDSGYTLLDTDGIDFDGITGINGFSINLSDNTDAGFYTSGGEFDVIVSSVTIDGATINFHACSFSIDRIPKVNVVQISDDSTAADNAELAFDGTGYGFTNCTIPTVTTLTGHTAQTGDSYARLGAPAGASVSADIAAVKTDTGNTQTDIGTITDLGGGATVGANLSDMAGATFSSATDSQEAIRDRGDAAWTTGAGGTPPQLLQSTTIATLASQTSFTLTAGSADDDAYNGMLIVVTDSVTSTQKAVGEISNYTGSTKTVTLESDPAVFTMAVGDTVDVIATPSSAKITDDVWDEVLSGATHNVVSSAGRRLRSLQDNGLYALAGTWVDEVAGTSTGTTDYEDATVTNRANDFDNAQTVAASVGLNAIYVTNGNSITLTATINNFTVGLPGGNWTLALGGQDIGGCDINDAVISGTCTGTDPHFHNCEVGTTTAPPSKFYSCGLSGTLTIGSAGDFDLVDCYSLVPGASAPVIDLGAAVGSTNMSIRRWSGGLTLNNVQTGDVISVDGISGGTVTVNGTGGTVHVRGMVAVTDGSSGSVTIVQTQAISNTSINAEVDTAISDASLATSAALATAQTDLDTITGADGATLATTQGAITWGQQTISVADGNANIELTGSGTGDGLVFSRIGSGGLFDTNWAAAIQQESTDALNAYDPPTKTEMDTSFAALNDVAATDIVSGGAITTSGGVASANMVQISGDAAAADNLEESATAIVTGAAAAGTLSTTQMTTNLTETTDDHYIGRVIVWTSGVLANQATDITDYDGTSKLLTYTATTEAPSASDTFVIV